MYRVGYFRDPFGEESVSLSVFGKRGVSGYWVNEYPELVIKSFKGNYWLC